MSDSVFSTSHETSMIVESSSILIQSMEEDIELLNSNSTIIDERREVETNTESDIESDCDFTILTSRT